MRAGGTLGTGTRENSGRQAHMGVAGHKTPSTEPAWDSQKAKHQRLRLPALRLQEGEEEKGAQGLAHPKDSGS